MKVLQRLAETSCSLINFAILPTAISCFATTSIACFSGITWTILKVSEELPLNNIYISSRETIKTNAGRCFKKYVYLSAKIYPIFFCTVILAEYAGELNKRFITT